MAKVRLPKPPPQGEEELALHIRVTSGVPEPARQHAFAAEFGRGWRFDFAWTEPPPRWPESSHLAVEVVGEEHRIRGRHRADMERLNAAQMLGWTVLQFRPREVTAGVAIRVLAAIFGGDSAALERYLRGEA